jgi:glycosyltransferase involved in cell wall biosynthesis
MHFFALIAGWLCLFLWLYLLLAHGRFWMVESLDAKETGLLAIHGLIAVVIPARDEADVVGEAIHSLLQQSCASTIHIFLVDDGSTDGTAQVAREAASTSAHPQALTVICGQPLPDGWTGKLWAMQQGINRALQLHPQFLLLTDADIKHAPENMAILVGVAERGGYDLASFMVKLHCRSLPEKLLIPGSSSFSSCCIRRSGFEVRVAKLQALRVAVCWFVRKRWSGLEELP